MPIKALASRLSQSYQRPLLAASKDNLSLEEKLQNQLNSRLEYFEQADITCNALTLNAQKIDELASQIRQAYTK
jgi:shikimate kinase